MSVADNFNDQSTRALHFRLDRLVIGLRGKLLQQGLTASHVREALRGCSELAMTNRGDRHGEVHFDVLLHSADNDVQVGHASVLLHLQPAEVGLVITNRSHISFNPLRLTRGLCEADGHDVPAALDGSDNFVGVHVPPRDIEADQHTLVAQSVQFVHDALAALLPSSLEDMGIWLKTGELCIDLPVENAHAVTRALQRRALRNAIFTERDHYRTRATDDGQPVVRWYLDKSGTYLKAYAKLPNLLRLEIVCPVRKAVKLLHHSPSQPFNGDGARLLTIGFAAAAAPMLADLVCHVEQAMSHPSGATLCVALLPLVSMAAGLNTGRGPAPNSVSVTRAADALDAFLDLGMYDARGIPQEHAVRKVLDRLVEGGTLARHGRRAAYYVS